jgi:hypothetical protein
MKTVFDWFIGFACLLGVIALWSSKIDAAPLWFILACLLFLTKTLRWERVARDKAKAIMEPTEPTICEYGQTHVISSTEPFIIRELRDGNKLTICLRCEEWRRRELDIWVKELEYERAKKAEWNEISEDERERRREEARELDFCPRCDRKLTPKGSCPMCCEYPNHPKAPMNRVKRILEWISLSEPEKQKREAEFLAERARNLATWCKQDANGVWRRLDDGTEVTFE